MLVCPGDKTGEDEVDIPNKYYNDLNHGLSKPKIYKSNGIWFPNEIVCVRDGQHHLLSLPTPFGYFKYLLIERRPITVSYPTYVYCSTRVITFKNWKNNDKIPSPYELAEAGLFNSGEKAKVVCFHCGIKLVNWQAGDRAWDEHFKFSPNCEFVKSCYVADEDI